MPAKSHFLIAVSGLLQISAAFALDVQRDVEYATVGAIRLKLDIYKTEKQAGPIIVWIHGGAWRSGSKSSMPLADLFQVGYSIASVDYRLSPEARFPAQVHDIKAAIRFLRAKGGTLGLDARRIVVAGDSAGGHLAALVGVTNGSPEHEGSVGSHHTADSSVQGIISFYGAANLTTILDQSTPHGLKVRIPALDLFLGGQPQDLPDVAKLASPLFFVDSSDPLILLIHGDQDPQMPINQAHELHGAYKNSGVKASFEVVHGGAHGGKLFYDSVRLMIVEQFLRDNFPQSEALTPK